MNKKIIFFGLLSLLPLTPLVSNADLVETQLWFEPVNQSYSSGDTIYVDLYADILELDAIFGFSFDLSFDGGNTFVSSVGDTGSYLTFSGFVANSTYFDTFLPPLWDDGDTIAAEVLLPDPLVWGDDILLGTFSFTSPAVGPLGVETISLYPAAGDYGIFGDEGLLGSSSALMPNNPSATVAPVPEPATMLLFGTGLTALVGLRRKVRK